MNVELVETAVIFLLELDLELLLVVRYRQYAPPRMEHRRPGLPRAGQVIAMGAFLGIWENLLRTMPRGYARC